VTGRIGLKGKGTEGLMLREVEVFCFTCRLWMSPKCPKLGTKEVKSGIGSNFKADLIEYLVSYPAKCLLSQWINAIRQIDSAQIK